MYKAFVSKEWLTNSFFIVLTEVCAPTADRSTEERYMDHSSLRSSQLIQVISNVPVTSTCLPLLRLSVVPVRSPMHCNVHQDV